ncbi:MAG: ATP-binding protein [Candidatus Sigynarchaeota archaeon]
MEIFKDSKSSSQVWERAFLALDLGFVVTDYSGTIQYANAVAGKILGEENLLGKNVGALLTSALPSKKNINGFVESVCQESQSGEAREAKLEIEAMDRRIVKIKAFYLHVDGIPGYWPAFIIDVSNQALPAESLYWESLEKLWDSSKSSIEILRAIPSAIFICKIKRGGKLTVLDCNPAAEKLAGKSLAQLQGIPLMDFWKHEDEKNIMRQVVEGSQSGKPFTFENLHVKENGAIEKAYKIQVFFMLNDRAGVILDDITKQKQAEKILEDEIAKLKEIDELKNNFIAVTSHELKTPLVSMCGAVEFLLTNYKASLGSDELKFVEMINRGATRLKSLVNSLLDISQIQTGKIELVSKDDDFVMVLNRVVKEQEYLLESRNQNLVITAPPSLVFPFDTARIEQVLTNLITNAIKNTQPGGRIEVHVSKDDLSKEITTSVIDNGVGITNEEKEKLFTRFGKINREGVKLDLDIQGTGLGLFITKEIIERHGGRIWVESEGRYKGSKFTFVLPLEQKRKNA